MVHYSDAWYHGGLVSDHHLVNGLVFKPPFENGSAIQMPGIMVNKSSLFIYFCYSDVRYSDPTIIKYFFKSKNKFAIFSSLEWGQENESELLVGLRCQTVKVFDVTDKSFTSCTNVKAGDGPLRGVARFNDTLVTGI